MDALCNMDISSTDLLIQYIRAMLRSVDFYVIVSRSVWISFHTSIKKTHPNITWKFQTHPLNIHIYAYEDSSAVYI